LSIDIDIKTKRRYNYNMIFADLLFIYIFLPLNLLFYFAFKNTAYRNAVLVVFSLLFYAWGEPVTVFLLIATAVMNQLFAIGIEKKKYKRDKRILAVLSIGITLLLLGLFKYSGLFHLPIRPSLPIGISFYSFQIISYVADVYKGKVKAQRSPLKFLMYVSLYPQLIAGPIVRYSDVMYEIDNRRITAEGVSKGITRFAVGLSKKVLLANQIGAAASGILTDEKKFVGSMPVMTAWVGIALFALQIYYDFSGYSDMAIGLGSIFGFNFPENFDYPYTSKSITEFWRRWHMTLGGFFRDYVYIPLGGGRSSVWRNLAVTWFLTGLWHGASWNFALWGMYFGVFIILEKAFLLKLTEKVPKTLRIIAAMFAVTFGWAIFYYTDFGEMTVFIKNLFGMNGAGFALDEVTVNELYQKLFIVIIAVVFCAPVCGYIQNAAARLKLSRELAFITPFANAAMIIICSVMLVGGTYNAFLYYRF